MGAVLKGNMIGGLDAKVTKFTFADVRVEAATIIQRACDQLDRAKEEAQNIIEQGKTQAAQAFTQAQKDGYQAGFEQGLAEGRKQGNEQGLEQAKATFTEQAAQLRTTLEEVLKEFQEERNHLMVQAHQDLLALALALAVKVTRRQLQIDPQIVLENIKAAIRLVSSRTRVILKMNPTDIDRYNLMDPEKAQKFLNMDHIKVVKDETVEVGGCIIETENGQIDAQVSTQLENLIRQMAPAMEQTVKTWTSGAE